VWTIEHYLSETGRSQVREFIDSLDSKSKSRVAKTLDLLEEFGINLGMPYTRHLEKNLCSAAWLFQKDRAGVQVGYRNSNKTAG
jgi:hypothetical protein